MSMTVARTDISTVGRWWWTIDKWILAATTLLIFIGIILNFAAGPPAAERIGVEMFHFVRRQMVFLPLTIMVIFGISLLAPVQVRRFAVIGFLIALGLMVLTLLIGIEVKGAKRWIYFAGMSLQPSEFIKPFFAVVAAWMFSEHRLREDFPGNIISMGLLFSVIAVLLSQPDIGMTLVVTAVWCAQFFMAGLPIFWVILIIVAGMGAIVSAYFTFPHVASRVDRFLDPTTGDSYQITQAMRAFQQGGLFGRGPGEGRVKEALPDAHTDFIFAVAGEEFGILLCLLMVALFAFLVIRALLKVLREENMFVLLAVGGLAVQFGLQAIINMASSLHMMPTKGMTLPFISYGGSSLVALGVGMGMILALTRRRRDLEGHST
ncbi:MAG: putative lipid II flippase FtsW [Alphaproteobacteria bacterium]|nr:putative lipid II flippase FtsW [Alphaproteobacteria bacterium]PHX99676.1 MAG: putative lipid II flippase FtsW [Rhodospirillaceae bacterium]